MECLLVLTSRKSGDWFKEELREAGAIVCISDSIIGELSYLVEEFSLFITCEGLSEIKQIVSNHTERCR